MYTIYKTIEYKKWLNDQLLREQAQIEKRLSNIEIYGHFGDYKDLKCGIWELKWTNGRRIYFTFIEESEILLLYGGNKNGQNKDIVYAKKVFKKNTSI